MMYNDLLKKLFVINREKNNSYKLENMLRLSAYYEHPEKSYETVHVAGSNGKGSVTTKIAKGLELSGLSVGLYTSPHISSFRERIRINGELISEESVTHYLTEIFSFLEMQQIKASFFEITTLMAFRYFADRFVDIAVIETGLGGRLDSTNIIQPKLSVITTISLEHTAILGKTLPEIAREKAGIIKYGTPVILGPKTPIEVLKPYADNLNARCIPIEGSHVSFDEENSAIAKKCLEELKIDAKSIEEGCKSRPACRIEKFVVQSDPLISPLTVILDVAHNPEGLESLFHTIQNEYPHATLRILCGFSSDKEIEPCLSILMKYGVAFHIVEANHKRALPAQQLYEKFLESGTFEEQLFLQKSLLETLQEAIHLAAKNHELMVVCGSFFIMSPIRIFLGIEEAVDSIELNEYALPIRDS